MAAHQVGRVHQLAEAVQGRLYLQPVKCRQPVARELDAKALALQLVRDQDLLEIGGRIHSFAIHPHADVLDDGCVPGRAQIRSAGEERDRAVTFEHEALEHRVAERVVAREPVHALLAKHQERVELSLLQGPAHGLPPAFELLFRKMNRHGFPFQSRVRNVGSNSCGSARSRRSSTGTAG